MASSGPRESAKAQHRAIIFDTLRRQGPVSRTRLAADTGLSKATITRLLGEMLAEGLVEEVHTVHTGAGRPHVLLALVAKARYAVGMELTAETVRGTLTDVHAQPLRLRIRPVDGHGPDELAARMVEGLSELVADLPPSQLVGVGISAPGRVEPHTGAVDPDLLPHWRNLPLADLLQRQVQTPVAIFNRAQAAAWGERWYGIGRQVNDLLFIRLGANVEGGLILGNVPHTGKTFSAGAIGHMAVEPEGLPCVCGSRGCLHAYANTQALLARARALLREQPSGVLLGAVEGDPAWLTLDHLVAAAKKGDAVARTVFAEAGRAVGIVVAGLINLLNPEMVIIGGPVSRAGQALLGPLRQEVERRALALPLAAARIELTQLGADAACIGAASLMLRQLGGTDAAANGLLTERTRQSLPER